MIAFTNHALDHMLSSVLDAGITDKLVRLGSRSADERISKYSIETLELVAGKSRLDRSFGRHHFELKKVEEEITKLMKQYLKTHIDSQDILQYLQIQYPEHHEYIVEAPQWIKIIKDLHSDEGWKRAWRNGRVEEEDHSIYAFWRTAGDIDFLQTLETIQTPAPVHQGHLSSNQFVALQNYEETAPDQESLNLEIEEVDDEFDEELPLEEAWQKNWPAPPGPASAPAPNPSPKLPPPSSVSPKPSTIANLTVSDLQDPHDFFFATGLPGKPPIPSSNRPLDELLVTDKVWSLSRLERQNLHAFWTEQVRVHTQEVQIQDFERVRKKHAEAQKIFNEGREEVRHIPLNSHIAVVVELFQARRQLLQNMDIVGCTTTGIVFRRSDILP